MEPLRHLAGPSPNMAPAGCINEDGDDEEEDGDCPVGSPTGRVINPIIYAMLFSSFPLFKSFHVANLQYSCLGDTPPSLMVLVLC